MIGVDTTFLVQLELVELPAHEAAHAFLQRQILQPQVPLALAPQVLAEFIHIVTDPRRFQKPLAAGEAVAKARFGWNETSESSGRSAMFIVQTVFRRHKLRQVRHGLEHRNHRSLPAKHAAPDGAWMASGGLGCYKHATPTELL